MAYLGAVFGMVIDELSVGLLLFLAVFSRNSCRFETADFVYEAILRFHRRRLRWAVVHPEIPQSVVQLRRLDSSLSSQR